MKSEESQKEKEFFIKACLKGSTQIKSWLKLDENGHQMLVGYAHQNSREYFIYSVLNEIEKAGVILINNKEFFKDIHDDKKADDRIKILILNAIAEDLSLWQRKLSELLLDLIGFTKSNELDSYRYYLYFLEIKRLKTHSSVLSEYYACNNQNIASQIDRLNSDLANLENNNARLQRTHYSSRDKNGDVRKINYREKLNSILPICTPAQKIVLGMSYENYSYLSDRMHTNPNSLNRFIRIKDLEHQYASIGLLGIHCLLVCKALLKKKPRKGIMGELSKFFRHNRYPNQLYHSITLKTKIKKGDFVIAYNDLAEVMEVKKSKFGYIAFRVKYLATPPIPSIKEDEFPFYHIHLYVNREFIRKRVVETIDKISSVEKVDHRIVSDSIRQTIVDYWDKLGGKEIFWGQRDLAIAKLQKHIQSANI